MADIKALMFRREHFPVRISEVVGVGSRVFYQFNDIQVPPYHPSMRAGINTELVLSVINASVQETMEDLEKVAEKDSARAVLTKFAGSDRKINPDQSSYNGHVRLNNLFIANSMVVGNHAFVLHLDETLSGISIRPGLQDGEHLELPKAEFSEELRREYDIEIIPGSGKLKCPHLWKPEGELSSIDLIFFKNLVMAMNNKIVQEKYSAPQAA